MNLYPAKKFPADDSMERLNETRAILLDYIRNPECKRLLNRISIAQSEANAKSVAILSQFPCEGKAVFICSLALGFMKLMDKRVLIMDTVSQSCDESFYFREVFKEQLNQSNEVEKRQGCIDLITTKNLSRKNLVQSNNETDSLAPVSYQSNFKFDIADFQVNPFVDSMKGSYDLILMDTCALSEVNKTSLDPLILAEYADASILFTSPDYLDRAELSKLSRQLQRHRIAPLGLVVNSGFANAH